MAEQFFEVHGRERATPAEVPPTGYRSFFAKDDGFYEMGADGVEIKISNEIPGETGSAVHRVVLLGANGSLTSATVGKNELSDAVVWAYSAEGVYTGTLVGAFTANKTNIQVTLGSATGGVIVKAERTSADVVTISSFLVTDGTTAADFIGTLNVQITVDV